MTTPYNIQNSKSFNNLVKNELSPLENKSKNYIRKIPINANKSEKEKVLETIMKEFNENFQDILLEPKQQFLKNITKEVDLIFSEVFQKKPLEYKQIKEYQKIAFEYLEKEYKKIYNFLSNEWENYMKNPKKYKYLSQLISNLNH